MSARVRINIRVTPNANRDQVVGWVDGNLKIKLQALAQDGKANAALCAFLAKELGCSRRDVVLIHGEKSRLKVVELPAAGGAEWLLRAAEA